MRVSIRLFRFDVFCSYSHADRDFVSKLASELTPEFSVFVDDWEIESGRAWRQQIDKGLAESCASIVVLSPDAVKSKEVEAELRLMFKRYTEEGRCLIPLLYRECDIPGLLEGIQYMDFRDHSAGGQMKAIRELRGALRKCLSKTTSLAIILLITILAIFLPVLVKGIVTIIQRNETFEFVRQIQMDVQAIEIYANQNGYGRAMFSGERNHHDLATNKLLVKDVWEEGKLAWRIFYRDGQIIARDSFRYDGEVAVEKERTYRDANQRIFLIDRFSQDGLIITKLYCPEGLEHSCIPYADYMRSPLPPPYMMSYR